MLYQHQKAQHGPYIIWTRKVKAKTVTRIITAEQADFCRQCIQNLRRLEAILEKMKEISVQCIESYKPTPRKAQR